MDGTTEWQTFLEPEVDEGYAGVAVWGSMFPIDPVRQQVSHLQPVELMNAQAMYPHCKKIAKPPL